MPPFNPRWTTHTLQRIYLISASAMAVLFVVLELINFASIETRLTLGTTLAAAGISLVLLAFNRHHLSVLVFGVVVWVGITTVVVLRGGLNVPATVFYPLVILLLGIFLRPKWALICGAISISTLAIILFLQLSGFISASPGPISPVHQFIFNAVSLAISAVIVFAASRAIAASTNALRESKSQEAERRHQLENQTAELRQANDALSISESRYRSVIDNAGDQIFLLAEDGIILDVNRQALTELKYPAAAVIGKPMTMFDQAWDQGFFETQLNTLPDDGLLTFNGRLRRQDGRQIPVEVRARKARIGEMTVIIGLFRDITERLKAEEKLRDSQKLQSLGLLAGGVAHDFNNLLVAMIGQTNLALEKLDPDHPVHENIHKAKQAAKQAAVITKQLLAYSGRGHFESIVLDLNQLITQNLILFRVGIPKRVELSSHLAEDLPTIIADPGQIQQVIMNLIINAAEAIGRREGTISVYTSLETVTPADTHYQQLTLTPLQPGRYVALEITDNGPGIDEDTLQKIFDPFFTTKQTGHGLGLAAVLGIIRGHDGGLVVYSEVGQGTSFKLLFPAAGAKIADNSTTPEITRSMATQAKILVVDDDPSVRDTIRDILELNGHEVSVVASGQAALDFIESGRNNADIVILDMTMPGLSGEETLDKIRQFDPNQRVILSSGYNQVEAARRLSGRPYSAFLQKPYTIDQLLSLVSTVIKSTQEKDPSI